MNKLIEKEIYAWNINDVWNVVLNEFKPLLPEELKDQICDGGIPEGIIFTLGEVYLEDEETPEFVKEYQGDTPYDSLDKEYMYHNRGIGDKDYTIGVLTVFKPILDSNKLPIDHKNRVIFIEIRDDYSEVLYRINYVK